MDEKLLGALHKAALACAMTGEQPPVALADNGVSVHIGAAVITHAVSGGPAATALWRVSYRDNLSGQTRSWSAPAAGHTPEVAFVALLAVAAARHSPQRLELDLPLPDAHSVALDGERGYLGVHPDVHGRGWYLLHQPPEPHGARLYFYARRHVLQRAVAEKIMAEANAYDPGATMTERLLHARMWEALFAWQQPWVRQVRNEAVRDILASPRHNGMVTRIAGIFGIKRQAVYQFAAAPRDNGKAAPDTLAGRLQ